MIVTCPSCPARFQYADARFQGALSKRFQCPRCGAVFEVMNPELPGIVPDIPALEQQPAPFWPAPATSRPAQSGPAPSRPVQPAPTPSRPVPPVPAGLKPTSTTSRKLQEAMMAAAGIGEGALPPGIRYSLAFLTGPQASTVRQISAPQTVIGREEGDVIINDPETSRRHARIEIHADGTAWLSDLGSTNGTSTSGRTIDGPTQLFDRQEFTCGKNTFMLLIRAVDGASMD